MIGIQSPAPETLLGESRSPWGSFVRVCENETSTVTLLTVRAGRRLSSEKHRQRDELWVVLDGTAVVTVDQSTRTVAAGDSVWVPRRTAHRLRATDHSDIRVLQVSFGWFDDADQISMDGDLISMTDELGTP